MHSSRAHSPMQSCYRDVSKGLELTSALDTKTAHLDLQIKRNSNKRKNKKMKSRRAACVRLGLTELHAAHQYVILLLPVYKI